MSDASPASPATTRTPVTGSDIRSAFRAEQRELVAHRMRGHDDCASDAARVPPMIRTFMAASIFSRSDAAASATTRGFTRNRAQPCLPTRRAARDSELVGIAPAEHDRIRHRHVRTVTAGRIPGHLPQSDDQRVAVPEEPDAAARGKVREMALEARLRIVAVAAPSLA